MPAKNEDRHVASILIQLVTLSSSISSDYQFKVCGSGSGSGSGSGGDGDGDDWARENQRSNLVLPVNTNQRLYKLHRRRGSSYCDIRRYYSCMSTLVVSLTCIDRSSCWQSQEMS